VQSIPHEYFSTDEGQLELKQLDQALISKFGDPVPKMAMYFGQSQQEKGTSMETPLVYPIEIQSLIPGSMK
jgi:hypothetical protein